VLLQHEKPVFIKNEKCQNVEKHDISWNFLNPPQFNPRRDTCFFTLAVSGQKTSHFIKFARFKTAKTRVSRANQPNFMAKGRICTKKTNGPYEVNWALLVCPTVHGHFD
jgi:hypothetical protein